MLNTARARDEPPQAAWSSDGGEHVLTLAGHWQGAIAELPEPTAEVREGRLRVDAQGLRDWDARLASALWQRLKGLDRQKLTVDLSGLPPGLQQILGLALPEVEEQTPAPPEADPSGDEPTPQPDLRAWLANVGQRVNGHGGELRTTFEFIGRTLLSLGRLARGRSAMRWSDLAWQVEQTGPRSLPIVALVSFLVGLIVAYMGAAQLERFGAQSFVADLVTVGVVREIAALLVGIVLAGRVGAAFAAQIGSMRANEEVDALETLGVDPVDHLVLPRVLALLIVGPLLTAFAALVGIGVGWLVAVLLYDVTPLEYLHKSLLALTLPHVLIGLLKGTVYSLLVALAGCRQGLAAGRSAQAVGDATTKAVVQAIVWMVVAASMLTVIFQRLDL